MHADEMMIPRAHEGGAAANDSADPDRAHAALVELGRALRRTGYVFVTVSPATHARVLRRRALAQDLRDVFGYSRPFEPTMLSESMLALLWQSGRCVADGEFLRSTVRFSTLGAHLFAHAAYPTVDSDAVFFGPDTHRFAAALMRWTPRAYRLVDIGCGSGAGGIVVGERVSSLVLADVNPRALELARVNAELADVAHTEVVRSDVLASVDGPIDVVVANPPYMLDPGGPTYRNGGGGFGEGLAARIVTEALDRLSPGGTLLLYTGSAIVDGRDTFRDAIAPALSHPHAFVAYGELDPDVFGEQLEAPEYADVERIAAVLLRVVR